jgi:hypothetical protein
MLLSNVKGGWVGISSALVASLCCLLPLAVVLLGLGSGAFMMVTMQYRWFLLPVGLIGVGLGYYFHFKERRRCASLGCAMVGNRFNLALLGIATVMLVVEMLLAAFPEVLSGLLQAAM